MKWITSLLKTRLDLLFFGVYLWIIPFSWRKVLIPSVIPGLNSFNEYTDISLYVGDFFLLLAFFILILKYRNSILSNIKNIQMFHVEHSILVIPLILTLYAYISIIWSNQRLLSLYSASILLTGVLSFFYILIILKISSREEKCSTWNNLRFILIIFSISALFQAIFGIAQFINQGDIGLWFLGEPNLHTIIPGVAEVVFNSIPILRSYGTFLHPNIYAAFLVFTLFLFHLAVELKMFHVEHRKLYWVFIYVIILIAIVLSVSKTAIIALFIGYLYLFNLGRKTEIKNVPRGTLLRTDGIHSKVLFAIMLVAMFATSIYLLNLEGNTLTQPVLERLEQYKKMLLLIPEIGILGLGSGQYVYNLAFIEDFDWKLQPIHNVFLLIYAELGILHLFIFMYFLYKIYKNVPRGTFLKYRVFIILISIFSLMDHYLWDIRSGQQILWIILAIVVSTKNLTNPNTIS